MSTPSPVTHNLSEYAVQGFVAVALIVGLVVLKAMGKPTDGLDPAVAVIVTVFFGSIWSQRSNQSVVQAAQTPTIAPGTVTVAPTGVSTVDAHLTQAEAPGAATGPNPANPAAPA